MGCLLVNCDKELLKPLATYSYHLPIITVHVYFIVKMMASYMAIAIVIPS